MRFKDLCFLSCLILVPSFISAGVTFLICDRHYNTAPVANFDDRISEIARNSTYDFLPEEMSSYILGLCKDLGVDPDLVTAILLNENPMLDTGAINKNTNNSLDVGLFQLNDRYLYTTFSKRYWKFKDVELNPFNWKHNAYVAVHHIHYLCKAHKLTEEVIMAYNCGSNCVMNNRVPESTKVYLARAKRNYYLLKNQVKIDFEVPEMVPEEPSLNTGDALASNQ